MTLVSVGSLGIHPVRSQLVVLVTDQSAVDQVSSERFIATNLNVTIFRDIFLEAFRKTVFNSLDYTSKIAEGIKKWSKEERRQSELSHGKESQHEFVLLPRKGFCAVTN